MTDSWSKAAVGYERIREILDTQGEISEYFSGRAGDFKTPWGSHQRSTM